MSSNSESFPDLDIERVENDVRVESIDAHSAGQPIRVVCDVAGVDIDGKDDSVRAVRDTFAERHDWLRALVNAEPRGHDNLVTVWMVEPQHDAADIGVFFTDNAGYLDMCGDGTIGTVSAMVDSGNLADRESIVLETPIGLVTARLERDNGDLKRVFVTDLDAYLLPKRTVTVDTPTGKRDVPVQLAYGGELYGLVNTDTLGLTIGDDATDPSTFVQYGMTIRERLNEQPVRLASGETTDVAVTMFCEAVPDGPDRNVIIYGDGALGRAPCGTGTCARMGALYDRGELGFNEPYPHQSILGTEYVGRLLDATSDGNITILSAEVGGRGYITGRQTFVQSVDDDLPGFRL